jgi:S-adenosylmethionine synthetase
LIFAAIQNEPGTSVTTLGYDKLKHDYDSRETTVNACLRENQKRDISRRITRTRSRS